MTLQGNGNMLIAKAYGLGSEQGRGYIPSTAIQPSRHLDATQYQMFLSIASVRELEGDLVLPSTWRFLK